MNLSSELKDLEELTTNAKQIQDDILKEILKVNANTEHLQRFMNGSFDKEIFKNNVPLMSYEDVKPYIEGVANGEISNVISREPITNFLLSSGTSGGKQKMFPVTKKFYEDMTFIFDLRSSVVSKYMDGVKEGKVMTFLNTKPFSTTPSGLPVGPAVATYLMSDHFKNRSVKRFTSPDQVILCPDTKQSMYCHLLCGLVQREEVISIDASFASNIIQSITFLETHWKELCLNIRSGYVSEWITDIGCKESVSIVLGGRPNLELADLIEQECCQKSWEGIITRLWPNAKFIQSIITGQMSQYIPILDFYSSKLPIFSSMYASSEAIFGVNVNPLCKPEDVSYTFMPNMFYFEFLLVDDTKDDEIVDLVNVKLGSFYEPLVTSYFGLYRYKMGDILQVTGFYNSAPQFKFVRRKSVVLSVQVETTTEEDLLKAITHAKHLLDSKGLMLMDFTSYSDLSTIPGHYVIYLELKTRTYNDIVKLEDKVMIECCCVMEESLDARYRKFRNEYDSIGALEIRVVQQGTFESLMEYFISNGASTSQYKTPICVKSPQVLAILDGKVFARFFSDKAPSL